MTDPYGKISARVLLETRFTGGHRHGGEKTQEDQSYDRWWRQRALEILHREV